ncbi:MAG: hypothetical protein PHU08_03920, partial [Dehalococcoidales bacterium]|nr:hypothetical protein [Dehalococcoidales bacterium]
DSTFALHQMVTRYRMRAIALTVDSGFILPEGTLNIERCTRALKVPHLWLKDEQKIKTASRNTTVKFWGWLKKPSINTIVPVLNAADKTLNLQMYRYAHAHHIPLVIGGNNVGNSSFEQENWKTGFMGIFPNARGFYSKWDKVRLISRFVGQHFASPYGFD